MTIQEPFPGPLKRIEKSFGMWRIVIMPKQASWIRRHFTNQSIRVDDIAEKIGVSRTWLNTWCNDHGIYRLKGNSLRDFDAAKARSIRAIATTLSTTAEPDKDLLRRLHEDEEPEPLGPCIGKTCYCYDQCMQTVTDPKTHKLKKVQREQCNAMF